MQRLGEARRQLDGARARAATALTAVLDLDFATADADLAAASEAFIRASTELGALEVRLLSAVPVLNRNIDGIRTMARSGALAADGARLATQAGLMLPVDGDGKPRFPLADSVVDIELVHRALPLLNEAALRLADARSELAHLPDGLAGVVERAREDLSGHITEAAERAVRTRDGLALLSRMGGGPLDLRRYLLVFENTAEMRGFGGMPLAYAVLEIDRGRISIPRIGSTFELSVTVPVAVSVPDDFRDRFGWQGPDRAMFNTTAGLDFPTAAPLLASLYETVSGLSVDGVIAADSILLARLAELAGPVSIEDPPLLIVPEQARSFLLRDQYRLAPERDVRRDLLGDFGGEVARILFRGQAEPRQLGSMLLDGLEERRLAVWLRDPESQRLATVLGASGRFPHPDGDLAAATVQNHGGNKLDTYLDTRLVYEATVTEAGGTLVRQTLHLHSEVTEDDIAGEPVAVVGPFGIFDDEPPLPAGFYRAWLSLYSGRSAAVIDGPSDVDGAAFQSEESHTVVSGFTVVPPGESRSASALFSSPDAFDPATGRFEVTLVPQPRDRPLAVEVVVAFPGGSVRAEDPGVVVDGSTARWEALIDRPTVVRLNWSP